MAYHHIGHFGDGGILRQHTADVLAVSEYSHSVGQRFDFMHFMGNDDDSLAVISHFPEDVKQLLGLLRCQYGGRLIQDQNIRTTVQYLYDLYRLLLGYGHIINLLLRVHFKTVFIADLLDFTGSFFNVQSTFQTQNNILGGRQYIDQLEMLMHHTDSQPQCILGRSDDLFLTVNKDLPLIRKINTGEHIHQCRLTAAVFSKQ